MQIDPLNDALVKMHNAEQAGKMTVHLSPASKLLGNVLEIMQKAGYVGAYELVENGRGGVYEVTLRGAINRCGTVKPRHSVRRQDYEPLRCEGRPHWRKTPRLCVLR